jgi:hypothetical protein
MHKQVTRETIRKHIKEIDRKFQVNRTVAASDALKARPRARATGGTGERAIQSWH